ncbi:MAG: hypothetical protein FGM52_05950 [Mycobacterium sp.]|nr:hypothetical protein [Mycobacterium sp.]
MTMMRKRPVVAETPDPARQAAAAELAEQLTGLADRLAAGGMRAKRVLYGVGLVKRRSPKGFVLDTSGPKLLLPDGRLWSYHTRLSPDGTYYNARVDHIRSVRNSIPLGDGRFSFLGAVVSKYNFGYRHSSDPADPAYELGAMISGDGGVPRYVIASEALAAVAAEF